MSQTYRAVARMIISCEAHAGFFLAEAWYSLSNLSKSRMKMLIESKLAEISNVLLSHPRMAVTVPAFKDALLGLSGDTDGQQVLDSLGIEKGFEPMEQEDAEFMIDLMETLLD